MAFQGAGFDIIIDAVLTDVGKKRMAQGKFKVSKFSFGDDEIDYRLFSAYYDDEEGYTQQLLTASIMEAGSTNNANILYGLQTFKRQDMLYLPALKVNKAIKIQTNPTLSYGEVALAHHTSSAYYLPVNQETCEKIDSIFKTGSFKYLISGDFTKNKIIIESGISEHLSIPGLTYRPPDAQSWETWTSGEAGRNYFILKQGLYDKNFFVYCDKRLIKEIISSDSCGSQFKNYRDGSADVNFIASKIKHKISYGFVYDNFECYPVEGIPNLISNFPVSSGYTYSTLDGVPIGKRYSELGGPRGSVVALGFCVDEELRSHSSGERDYRYADLGMIEQYVFDKTNKFDYIDTSVYVEGTSSRSSVNVPLRLIRYVGT